MLSLHDQTPVDRSIASGPKEACSSGQSEAACKHVSALLVATLQLANPYCHDKLWHLPARQLLALLPWWNTDSTFIQHLWHTQMLPTCPEKRLHLPSLQGCKVKQVLQKAATTLQKAQHCNTFHVTAGCSRTGTDAQDLDCKIIAKHPEESLC